MPVDPLEVLRWRRSAKWQTYPADVLPLTVAEMDFALAAPIAEALREAVERSDAGYAMAVPDLGRALAGLAGRRWNWDVDPASVTAVTDAPGPVPGSRACRTRVGLRFGAAGSGHARLNFATSPDILDQATARMAGSAG